MVNLIIHFIRTSCKLHMKIICNFRREHCELISWGKKQKLSLCFSKICTMHECYWHKNIFTTDMASNHAPLTTTEKEQLRTQPNVDLIIAWALVRGISHHPEVLEQIALKQAEVGNYNLANNLIILCDHNIY